MNQKELRISRREALIPMLKASESSLDKKSVMDVLNSSPRQF